MRLSHRQTDLQHVMCNLVWVRKFCYFGQTVLQAPSEFEEHFRVHNTSKSRQIFLHMTLGSSAVGTPVAVINNPVRDKG